MHEARVQWKTRVWTVMAAVRKLEALLSHSILIFTADEQNGQGLESLPVLKQKLRSCYCWSAAFTFGVTVYYLEHTLWVFLGWLSRKASGSR